MSERAFPIDLLIESFSSLTIQGGALSAALQTCSSLWRSWREKPGASLGNFTPCPAGMSVEVEESDKSVSEADELVSSE